jgi:transcription termination factor Rho
MSVGQEFDQSLLERKDRAELAAIATSLGEKPPSRAKKSDIVALIMRLVGAAADVPSSPGGAGTTEAPQEATGEEATSTEATPEDATRDADRRARPPGRGGGRGPNGFPERSADSGGGAAESRAESRSAERAGARGQEPQRGRDQGDRAQGNQGEGNRGDQGQSDQGQSDQGQGNRNHGNQNRGAQTEGNRNQANQDQGDDDSGNRRRRRRGRDRSRGGPDDDGMSAEPVDVDGLVDLRDEGYGFLRVAGYLPSRDDAYISVKQVRQFSLRKGDRLKGRSRAANRNEKNPALLQVDEVNGRPAAEAPQARSSFDDLTPLFPDERLRLEQTEFPENLTARIIDLLAPVGKGQRGLIVSPPKAGKTTVMKQIVRAIERNHPEVHLMVLLVDERPEEVTDMKRWLIAGEVASSTFDRPTEEHTAVAELVIERAKRLVEDGKDVVIVLDGITRLARAYNLAAPATGRVMAGGIDTGALYPPKKFFGAARNMEEGGSLTILATALVETNTRMDEVIFEEFKGTGNMELRLDRRLADRRIYPAIDVDGSSTRHEELLYDRKQLQQIYRLRRVLSGLKADSGSGAAGVEMLTDRLKTFRTNEAFLDEVAKAPDAG